MSRIVDQDLFSPRALAALCKDGNIKGVQTFLEKTLPSLPRERQYVFCHHLTGDPRLCDDLPCTASMIHLSETAAQGGQAEIFAYLWNTFLAPRGITSVSWPCLKTAAFQGAIPLAQAFWFRDPDCFNTIEPRAVHPPGARRSGQVEIAIRNDRFEYIDFMLAHGADINAGGNDLLRIVVRCAKDDAITLYRIQFLVSRGARAAGTGALREVVAGGNIELASCLLDSGVEVDDVIDPERTSSLMVAAREGYQEMVELLLDRGASTELVDREGRDAVAFAKGGDHVSIVELLQAHRCKVGASKTET